MHNVCTCNRHSYGYLVIRHGRRMENLFLLFFFSSFSFFAAGKPRRYTHIHTHIYICIWIYPQKSLSKQTNRKSYPFTLHSFYRYCGADLSMCIMHFTRTIATNINIKITPNGGVASDNRGLSFLFFSHFFSFHFRSSKEFCVCVCVYGEERNKVRLLQFHVKLTQGKLPKEAPQSMWYTGKNLRKWHTCGLHPWNRFQQKKTKRKEEEWEKNNGKKLYFACHITSSKICQLWNSICKYYFRLYRRIWAIYWIPILPTVKLGNWDLWNLLSLSLFVLP